MPAVTSNQFQNGLDALIRRSNSGAVLSVYDFITFLNDMQLRKSSFAILFQATRPFVEEYIPSMSVFSENNIICRFSESELSNHIESIFDRQQIGFYSEKLVDIRVGLAALYITDQRKISDCRELFDALVQQIFGAKKKESGYLIDDERYPDPFRILFSTDPDKQYHSGICHGDLNSNNVIISDGRIIFIDFQDTGRGHVFADFLALESSVRLFHPASENETTQDLIRNEQELLKEEVVEDALVSRYRLIQSIRRRAFSIYSRELFVEYLFGTIAIHLRLLRLQDLAAVQQRILMSCIIINAREYDRLATIKAS